MATDCFHAGNKSRTKSIKMNAMNIMYILSRSIEHVNKQGSSWSY
jgi:hypothetical protein